MSRLLLLVAGLAASVRPASAQVCDRVLADWGGGALIHAPLWRYVAQSVLSPLPLVLVLIAVLTATKLPQLRGIAVIAGIVALARAASSIGENVYPTNLILQARLEGCGGASLASAVVSSGLAVLLLGAFLLARTESTGPQR